MQVAPAGRLEGLAADDLTGSDQGDQQLPVVPVIHRRRADADGVHER